MTIYELVIDENAEVFGIDAISIVESPAIESDFVALKSDKVEFAEVDSEKRLLLGAALVPNKPIYRRDDRGEFYVYFTKNTIRRAMELFMSNGFQNNSTLEHEMRLQGLSVVESWIVEGEKDKAYHYELDVPVGTWMVSVKVNNEAVWDNFVKTGRVKGFSIEGYFANKNEVQAEKEIEEVIHNSLVDELELAIARMRPDKRKKSGKRLVMESYSDYPESVKNNAKRGIELNEKNGNKCATQTGKVRAQQLAKGEPISLETIKRMYSYLSRAEEDYENAGTNDCGNISYLLWGGKSALAWSRNKLRELDELD